MFESLFGFVRDTIQFIWPFRIVEQWERAGYYVCGHWWREMGPGLKAVVPWFCEVRNVSVQAHPVTTGRMDITLSDGSTLSFDATANMRVTDVNLALNAIDDCHHSTSTIVAAVLAGKLAEVDAARVAPDKRGRLFSDLHRWVNEETQEFGVAVEKIRFNSFVLNIRTYRLLTDSSVVASF